VRPVWLKATAALVTLGTTVASAVYVSAHLKNAGAPLQPAVVAAKDNGGGATVGGTLGSGSGVEPADGAPVASTYAS
jgi:aspartyl aminopeptidase